MGKIWEARTKEESQAVPSPQHLLLVKLREMFWFKKQRGLSWLSSMV